MAADHTPKLDSDRIKAFARAVRKAIPGHDGADEPKSIKIRAIHGKKLTGSKRTNTDKNRRMTSVRPGTLAERLANLLVEKLLDEGQAFSSDTKQAVLQRAFAIAAGKLDLNQRTAFHECPSTVAASVPPLPETMAVLWTNRARGEYKNPVDFLARIYEPWVNKGLTRADVLRRDPDLYNALTAHIRIHGLPDGLDLPTQREVTDRRLANAAAEHPLDVARALLAVSERERKARVHQP